MDPSLTTLAEHCQLPSQLIENKIWPTRSSTGPLPVHEAPVTAPPPPLGGLPFVAVESAGLASLHVLLGLGSGHSCGRPVGDDLVVLGFRRVGGIATACSGDSRQDDGDCKRGEDDGNPNAHEQTSDWQEIGNPVAGIGAHRMPGRNREGLRWDDFGALLQHRAPAAGTALDSADQEEVSAWP